MQKSRYLWEIKLPEQPFFIAIFIHLTRSFLAEGTWHTKSVLFPSPALNTCRAESSGSSQIFPVIKMRGLVTGLQPGAYPADRRVPVSVVSYPPRQLRISLNSRDRMTPMSTLSRGSAQCSLQMASSYRSCATGTNGSPRVFAAL